MAISPERALWSRVRIPLPLLSLIVAGVGWEVLTRLFSPQWLPPLSEIAVAWWELLETGRFSELAVTAQSLTAGMVLVAVCATLIVLLFQVAPVFRDAFDPYLDALMAAPVIAVIPVLMLMLGTGPMTRIATILIFALAPVVVTWDAALRRAPHEILEMARAFGATSVQRAIRVRLPQAAPVLVAGIRIGVIQAIKGAVSAEVLIAVVGVGRLLSDASAQFDLPTLYAVVMTILAASIVAYLILTWIEKRTSRHRQLGIRGGMG